MSGPVERVRAAVASRVVRAQALEELAARIDEVGAAAEENAALARGLEELLDALEAEVVGLADAALARRER